MYKNTKKPKFLPCSKAIEMIFLNNFGLYFKVMSLKSKVITKVCMNRTLLPYSKPFLSPLSNDKIYCCKIYIKTIWNIQIKKKIKKKQKDDKMTKINNTTDLEVLMVRSVRLIDFLLIIYKK